MAFRGHDESINSKNHENFFELIKFTVFYNDEVKSIVLENVLLYAKYTSPMIQEEILHVLANNVRKKIWKEIGDSKFCIIVDEASDEFKRE